MKNLCGIIRKFIKSRGYKNGSLKIGVIDNEFSPDAFLSLKKDLSCIYFYSESHLNFDDFYKKTGIPVIIKNKPEENECDILIVRNEVSYRFPTTVKLIIETGGTDFKDSRCISDIKVSKNVETGIIGIKKSILNELAGIDNDIEGFVKKTLDTNT